MRTAGFAAWGIESGTGLCKNAAAIAEPSHRTSSAVQFATPMLTVLIVDDNVGFRAQAARLCNTEGFATVSAGSLSELATVLSTSAPDLALVDIELPQIP